MQRPVAILLFLRIFPTVILPILLAACGAKAPAGDDDSEATSLVPEERTFPSFDELAGGQDLASLQSAKLQSDAAESLVVVEVDLRSNDTRVKNQGQRGTCTAFATIAAMEHHAKKGGKTLDLSEEQLWSLYAVGNTSKALAAADNQYFVTETIWPYNGSAGDELEANGRVKMKTARSSVSTPKAVNEALSRGNPLVIAAAVTTSLKSPPSSGKLVPGKPNVINPNGTVAGHAMLVVGIQKDTTTASTTGGGYFVIKNSWDTDAGDDGYVYMPFSYCDSDTYCYFNEIPGVEMREPES